MISKATGYGSGNLGLGSGSGQRLPGSVRRVRDYDDNDDEPFLFGEQSGFKLNLNTLSQAGFWAEFNIYIFILALLPPLVLLIIGVVAEGLEGAALGFGSGMLVSWTAVLVAICALR